MRVRRGAVRWITVDDRVRAVEVNGFTSIGRAFLELRDLNVLIGANGAGKSNFIRALELLAQIVNQRLSLYVGEAGGASAILNKRSPVEEIRLVLDAGTYRYVVSLTPSADDRLIFAVEEVGTRESEAADWHAVSMGRGHKETELLTTGFVEGPGRWAANRVVDLLHGCRVYHFHDTSRRAPVKRSTSVADNLMLRPDAANLAAVLARYRESGRPDEMAAYRRIVGVVNQVAPFFDDFVLEPHGADNIQLRWRERQTDSVFFADQMSDGTLRFVCLATLLLSPELPRLVVLDEPELGLHPSAIVQLAALVRSASHRSQILLATQSVTLLNQFDPDDVVVVERSDDGTTLRRPSQVVLANWLDDYSLGELWEKNIIGGRPGRAGGSLA